MGIYSTFIPICCANLLASSLNTTFLSGSSFLFPTSIRLTTSQFWSISCNHLNKRDNANFILIFSYLIRVLGILQLPFYIGEGLARSDIIYDNNTMRSAIVRGSDSSKSFLSCCIPYLKFDSIKIDTIWIFEELYN